MIEEGKRYFFKKDYESSAGTIKEGREINYFRGTLWMDGIIIPQPFCNEIKRLFNDDKFINEYIKIKDFSNSTYVI